MNKDVYIFNNDDEFQILILILDFHFLHVQMNGTKELNLNFFFEVEKNNFHIHRIINYLISNEKKNSNKLPRVHFFFMRTRTYMLNCSFFSDTKKMSCSFFYGKNFSNNRFSRWMKNIK